MSSGDTIFILDPLSVTAPGTLFATLDTIEDGSTPTAILWVLDFIDGTDKHADWHVTVPSNYDGGGFTISWKGGTDNTSVGSFILDIRALVIADAAILTGDLGIDTQTETPISDTPPTTPINKMNQSATATMTHANAGSPVAGDRMIIRATRDTVADANTGVLQLQEILILET